MSRTDRKAALEIAKRSLPAKKNPPTPPAPKELEDLELAVSRLWSDLHDAGVNIGSLSEDDVIQILHEHGLPDDAIQIALEEQATWSSGDDEDEGGEF